MRPKLYQSNLSETEFWEHLSFLIEVESNDKLVKHVSKFNAHRRGRIFGRIEGNQFWIWQHGLLSGGIFYPVFYGEIHNRQGKLQVEMNSKPNSLGGVVFMLITLVLAIALAVWLLFFQEGLSNKQVLFNIMVAGLLFIAFQAIPNLTYTVSKRIFRRMLEEDLQLERTN